MGPSQAVSVTSAREEKSAHEVWDAEMDAMMAKSWNDDLLQLSSNEASYCCCGRSENAVALGPFRLLNPGWPEKY